jgi:hypothetical protein
MISRRVALYGKPGCHLCDDVLVLLEALRGEFDLTIREIDIHHDPMLLQKYWDKIPVLVIDEHTKFFPPIRIEAVRAALQKL